MSDYKFTKIEDMAYTRKQALDKCWDLAEPFIEHFEKIYKNPKAQTVHNWCVEMQTKWFKPIEDIVFKHNHKQIEDENIYEWFLTRGSSPEVLFKDNPEKAKIYKEFCEELLKTRDVEKSLINIGLIK